MPEMNLYKASAGAFVRRSGQGISLVIIPDLSDALDGGKLVATAFRVQRTQDTEHQKTLSAAIYSYAFGERMGVIEVSGLAFFVGCPVEGGGEESSGLKKINDAYSENNIYAKKVPIGVSIGDMKFQAYLESLQLGVESLEFNTGTFSLTFSVIPNSEVEQ